MVPGWKIVLKLRWAALSLAICSAGCAINQTRAAALPGWRIYTPPATPSYPFGSVETPVSQWTLSSDAVYTSAFECEQGAKQFSNKYEPRIFNCLANDDPRLAGKHQAQIADSDHINSNQVNSQQGDPRFPLTQ